VAKRLDWRGYLVGADACVQALPRKTWRALKTRSSGLPEYADRTVHIVYAFVLCNRTEPTLLVALEGVVWRLDPMGLVDYGVPAFDERRMGLATAFLADALPENALQTGDRWQPCAEIRQTIARLIWPDGAPDIGPVPIRQPATGNVALQHALAAVSQADAARSVSHLADELALSRQAKTQLIQALQVDPRALEEFIAAESTHDARIH